MQASVRGFDFGSISSIRFSNYSEGVLCGFAWFLIFLLNQTDTKLTKSLKLICTTETNYRFDLLCLTPLSEIFQLYHGDQFQWWKKSEYPERTTDNGQATGKLYHLRLRVECTFFVIYQAGCEPTPYWWQACMRC